MSEWGLVVLGIVVATASYWTAKAVLHIGLRWIARRKR